MKYIKLNKGLAVVDDEDFEHLSKFNWTLNRQGYAIRRITVDGKIKQQMMHRAIMNTPEDMDTDHINNVRLDNRRSNLRICTHRENLLNLTKRIDNKSGYRGVCLDDKRGGKKWRAYISSNNTKYILGYFKTLEEAVIARQEATLKFHGAYAKL